MLSFANQSQTRLAFASRLSIGLTVGSVCLSQGIAAWGQTYSDLNGHWAASCINQLSQQQIVSGYPDGSFRPDAVINRAEYAALINQAFPEAAPARGAINFTDVPAGYWGQAAIQTAYQRGFLSGFPNQTFRPSEPISRAESFVALVSGLDYDIPSSPRQLLSSTFTDAEQAPDYAVGQLAAATQQGFLIAPPAAIAGPRLNPDGPATRSQVAAALCQIKLDTSGIPAEYVALPAEQPAPRPDIALTQTCTNETAGYRVRYPADWQTNQGEVTRFCRAFDPSEITLPDRAESFDEAVLIRVDNIPFDRIADDENITERMLSQRIVTIDGRQTIVTEGESNGRGLLPEGVRTYRYVVDLGDRILVGSTYDVATAQYERNKQVLAAMMESLELLP